MKNIIKICSLSLMLMFIITGCEEEDYELGALLSPADISFEVTQAFNMHAGGNTVVMKLNTQEVVPIWDFGTGRSNRVVDTVQYAFKGDYTIKLSVMSAGGLVELEPVVITVSEDDFTLVDHPLWDALTGGGPGNEKTWVLDIDDEANIKYFNAPLAFAGDEAGWEYECTVPDGNCWNWQPDYAGNEWMCTPGDWGTMTFSLITGPFVTKEQKLAGIDGAGQFNGTYVLDVNDLTLSFTDMLSLNHGWDNLYFDHAVIFELNENAMALGFHDKVKEEYAVLNYISKEYADNWVPEEPAGDPNFDHGDQGEILAIGTTKTWQLDLEVPYNWTNLNGDFLNAWSSRADIVATGWAPYGDGDVGNIDEASIAFSDDGTVTVTQDDGTSASGAYEVNESANVIQFTDIVPTIPIADWVTATTSSESEFAGANQWKIVVVEKDPLTDQAIGLWLGSRDPVKSEYMVFHFVLK